MTNATTQLTRHTMELTDGTISVLFLYNDGKAECEDWTCHGFYKAATYAATYCDRESMHPYIRSVELVWNGNVIASYSVKEASPRDDHRNHDFHAGGK